MTDKKSNKPFILGLAVALLLPLSLYFIVKEMSKGKVKMPNFYGIEKTEGNDTIYHQVAEIILTNQLGEKVSLNKDLKGKMVVINCIFTTCPDVCPRLTKSMAMLQSGFKKDTKKEASLDTVVHFVSLTIDPARDSFPALRTYADRFGANPDHWWFLTGGKAEIYAYIRNELGAVTGPGDGGAEDFIHTEKFILLDKDRVVRGYYDGLDVQQVKKCADDIVLLTLERKKKAKH